MNKKKLIEEIEKKIRQNEQIQYKIDPTGETAILRSVYQAAITSFVEARSLIEQLDESPAEITKLQEKCEALEKNYYQKICEDCKYNKFDDKYKLLLTEKKRLEKALEGAIVPRFKIGQYVWFYSRIDEKIVCSQVLGWSDWGNGIDYALRTYIGSFLEKDIFAIEAETEAAAAETDKKDE